MQPSLHYSASQGSMQQGDHSVQQLALGHNTANSLLGTNCLAH
jgi:hypothetical protein